MNVEEKLWKMIELLHDRTRVGSREWELTTSKKAFQTSFPNFIVRIAESLNEDTLDYVITILDENGNVVERASDVDIAETVFKSAPPPQNRKAFELMKDLYVMARRNAMGVEKALDSVLDALNNDPPF